jgi:Protein of unknown function (DUF3486)
MPAPRAIDLLPPPIKAELDARLIQSGFGGYEALSDWLKDQGFSIGISKSSLGEYGKDFKDRLAALKLSREMAIAYQQNLPDDQGAQAEMLGTLAQDVMFNYLMKVQDFANSSADEEEIEEMKGMTAVVSSVVRAIATLNRSDMAVRKVTSEIKAKQAAKFAELEPIAEKSGFDMAFIDRLKSEVLGIC